MKTKNNTFEEAMYFYLMMLLLGVAVVILSILIIEGGVKIRGIPISNETGYATLICGIPVIIISAIGAIRARKLPRRQPYTEEDIEHSKRELREMYIREHGHPPQVIEEESDK